MAKNKTRKFLKWKVSKVFSGKSLLFFLTEKLPSVPSKRALKIALEKNLCFINGNIERFASKKVYFQDEVSLDVNWEKYLKEKVEEFTIIYEDNDLCVINKGPNLVCDEHLFAKKGYLLCHRLDKQTTGVLLLAKNKGMQSKVFALFEKRAVKKEYLALADGQVQNNKGFINNRIGKIRSYQGQTIYGSGRGKEAVTDWKCLEKQKTCSFMLLKPKTGRTHQLRVHLSEMGHPILGDTQYSKKFLCKGFTPRLLLHSYKIELELEGKKMSFLAEIPLDFKNFAENEGLCLKF